MAVQPNIKILSLAAIQIQDWWVWLGNQTQPLFEVRQQDSTLLAPFESLLGLTTTALGPATKPDPIAFGKGGNAPSYNC